MEDVNFGNTKIYMIKLVRHLTGLGLREAKELVEGYPRSGQTDAPMRTAREFRLHLDTLEEIAAQRSMPERELTMSNKFLRGENDRLTRELDISQFEGEQLRLRLREEENEVTDLRREIDDLKTHTNSSEKTAIQEVIRSMARGHHSAAVDILLGMLERAEGAEGERVCENCHDSETYHGDEPCRSCRCHNKWTSRS